MGDGSDLLEIYRRLEERYDVERWHWRPGTPALEICLGAILVQHTAWTNVEKALVNLRGAGFLSVGALSALPGGELAALIRPAGMPLTKADRLKAFVALAQSHNGLERLLALPADELLSALRATPGIGPETAAAIALYASGATTFVHDAYTERLLRRVGVGPPGRSYRVWQRWLMERLPPDPTLNRRFHAAVVIHSKETCRSRPRCDVCPLAGLCSFGRGELEAKSL